MTTRHAGSPQTESTYAHDPSGLGNFATQRNYANRWQRDAQRSEQVAALKKQHAALTPMQKAEVGPIDDAISQQDIAKVQEHMNRLQSPQRDQTAAGQVITGPNGAGMPKPVAPMPAKEPTLQPFDDKDLFAPANSPTGKILATANGTGFNATKPPVTPVAPTGQPATPKAVPASPGNPMLDTMTKVPFANGQTLPVGTIGNTGGAGTTEMVQSASGPRSVAVTPTANQALSNQIPGYLGMSPQQRATALRGLGHSSNVGTVTNVEQPDAGGNTTNGYDPTRDRTAHPIGQGQIAIDPRYAGSIVKGAPGEAPELPVGSVRQLPANAPSYVGEDPNGIPTVKGAPQPVAAQPQPVAPMPAATQKPAVPAAQPDAHPALSSLVQSPATPPPTANSGAAQAGQALRAGLIEGGHDVGNVLNNAVEGTVSGAKQAFNSTLIPAASFVSGLAGGGDVKPVVNDPTYSPIPANGTNTAVNNQTPQQRVARNATASGPLTLDDLDKAPTLDSLDSAPSVAQQRSIPSPTAALNPENGTPATTIPGGPPPQTPPSPMQQATAINDQFKTDMAAEKTAPQAMETMNQADRMQQAKTINNGFKQQMPTDEDEEARKNALNSNKMMSDL